MTVKEFYEEIEADYDDVHMRLLDDERIKRFLLKFLNDGSYSQLCKAVENKDINEAFRAAHTLKGVTQNLSITPLYNTANVLTEKLRNAREYSEDIDQMLDVIKEDYSKIISCINMLDA